MRKFWSWLVSPAVSGAVGLIGFAFAIYTAFFYEKKPELNVSIDTLSRVFDVYRPIGGLEVSYGGENLRESSKTLWVLTATVKNVGGAELRRGDYDEKSPLGLRVDGATIVDRPVVKAKGDYLSKNLTLSVERNALLFSPVILEAEESFEVTALLLGPDSARPIVAPVGKVAGVKSIAVTTPDTSGELGVWSQAISGSSFWVHPARLAIYLPGGFLAFVAFALAGAAIVSPFQLLSDRREAAKRRSKVQHYRRHEELSREARFLTDRYLSLGLSGLGQVALLLEIYEQRRALIEYP